MAWNRSNHSLPLPPSLQFTNSSAWNQLESGPMMPILQIWRLRLREVNTFSSVTRPLRDFGLIYKTYLDVAHSLLGSQSFLLLKSSMSPMPTYFSSFNQ